MASRFLGITTTTKNKRQAFLDDDDDLASVSDMEAGFSGKNALFSTSSGRNGRISSSSFRAFSPRSSSSSSLRPAAIFYDARCEEPHHFLHACHLCKKPIGENKDIFMYRGDTPFCSEACRQEQIDMDEAEEKNRNLSMKASSRKDAQKSPSTPSGKRSLHVRTGTVVAG
ncbi:FCS-Like Zinc finger 1-like [Magnolia sinica]|uniref:FCS-Like Zinc finger 1-like n=1 Tax=Magnolia sinica TaxID=86752 RepID=UPI002658B668|nr:FCS-Like Zinc finger 1-like [Magnolia sinica]